MTGNQALAETVMIEFDHVPADPDSGLPRLKCLATIYGLNDGGKDEMPIAQGSITAIDDWLHDRGYRCARGIGPVWTRKPK